MGSRKNDELKGVGVDVDLGRECAAALQNLADSVATFSDAIARAATPVDDVPVLREVER